jgi:Flagellar protein FliT
MDNSVVNDLEQLLECNRALYTLVEQEAWEAFTDDVEGYTVRLNRLSSVDFNTLADSEREMAIQCLETLLMHDAQLMQCIQARLNTLSGEMSSLRKSRSSAHAYTAV